MKTIPYSRWYLRSEVTGKRKASRWKMPEAEARKHDPNAEIVPGTTEYRTLPETPEEYDDTRSMYRPNHG